MTPRVTALIAVVAATFAVVLSLDPIPQDPAYHQFADSRRWLGIPNFLDVASNLPFLIVGLSGVAFTARRYSGVARLEWTVFFAGVLLVTAGSSYYHWAPSNATLAWDRAPMTIAFMALLAALVAETVSPRAGRLVLVPAVVLGIASVVYWYLRDDLRFYVWVQFFPLLLIVLLLVLFPGKIRGWPFLLGALALYGVSKLVESFDDAIFAATRGIVAGHALKHLAAAAGCYAVFSMLRRRALSAPGAS